MSSTGTIVEHPLVTGIRDAAEALDPANIGVVWQLSDDDVEAGLACLFDMASRGNALQGALLREAETRDLKARTGASTLVRWLGDRFRLSRADAGARVRTAEGLARHPVLRCALGSGDMTVEQAVVLTGVLDTVATMPGVEEVDRAAARRFLLAQCQTLTPRDLARAGQAVVEALTVTPSMDDPADESALERGQAHAEAEAQGRERNFLTVTKGRGKLRAMLELGTIGDAILLQWLHSTADKRHAGCDGFEDTRPLSERRGDALVDLLAAAAGTPTARTTPDDNDDVLPGLEKDAIGTTSGLRDAGPATAVLTVTTTLDGLRGGLARAARLDTGLALSAAALRMLACDALIVPAVLGTGSEVLDLGRAQRDFNRAQRRAAALRDRGCVAPGCDQPPSACHVHHMWWWIEGGPTDLDNAALLCGFHHRMVHRQGWTMGLAPNGYPQLTPPKSVDPLLRPRQHHRFLIPDQQDPTLRTGRQRT